MIDGFYICQAILILLYIYIHIYIIYVYHIILYYIYYYIYYYILLLLLLYIIYIYILAHRTPRIGSLEPSGFAALRVESQLWFGSTEQGGTLVLVSSSRNSLARYVEHSNGKIHHFYWENPLFLWPFSIAFCMFTRGYRHRSYYINCNLWYMNMIV